MQNAKYKYVSLEALAAELCLPKEYLKNLASRGDIPNLDVNGKMRFNLQAVQQALDKLAAKGGQTMTTETPKKNQPAVLNITGLARYLGVGLTTVYEWIYSEQLPPAAKIINKRRYWTKQQIENFLGENSHGR